jgi:hypothetical protein
MPHERPDGGGAMSGRLVGRIALITVAGCDLDAENAARTEQAVRAAGGEITVTGGKQKEPQKETRGPGQ